MKFGVLIVERKIMVDFNSWSSVISNAEQTLSALCDKDKLFIDPDSDVAIHALKAIIEGNLLDSQEESFELSPEEYNDLLSLQGDIENISTKGESSIDAQASRDLIENITHELYEEIKEARLKNIPTLTDIVEPL